MEPIAVQIKRKGLEVDQPQIGRLREEFRDAHWVRMSRLFEPSILEFLQARLDNSQWRTMTHEKIGEEYVTDDLPALSLLDFAMNRPKFRAVMEEITGCKSLRSFRGRIYRVISGAGHYDSWHDDFHRCNEVGMSVNLSRNLFRGGLFMLRESDSRRVLANVANTGPGDALIFRISSDLQHRISDLEGAEPKTAFAGWFRSDLPKCFRDPGAQISTDPQEI
jgi:hypothetical protein